MSQTRDAHQTSGSPGFSASVVPSLAFSRTATLSQNTPPTLVPEPLLDLLKHNSSSPTLTKARNEKRQSEYGCRHSARLLAPPPPALCNEPSAICKTNVYTRDATYHFVGVYVEFPQHVDMPCWHRSRRKVIGRCYRYCTSLQLRV